MLARSTIRRATSASLAFAASAVAGCMAPLSNESTTTPASPSRRQPTVASSSPHDLTFGAALMTAAVYPRLSEAANPNANLFISPVSLSQGLGLAFIGARGGTRDEIGRVLGWEPGSNVPALTQAYNAQLIDTGDADIAVSVANALWLGKGFPIRSAYVGEARAAFGAAPGTVDYARDPNGAAERINGWVSRETKGRIREIVSASGFDATTAAVLTNALYFKAKWTKPFEDTETRASAPGFTRTPADAHPAAHAPVRGRRTSCQLERNGPHRIAGFIGDRPMDRADHASNRRDHFRNRRSHRSRRDRHRRPIALRHRGTADRHPELS